MHPRNKAKRNKPKRRQRNRKPFFFLASRTTKKPAQPQSIAPAPKRTPPIAIRHPQSAKLRQFPG